MSDPFYDSPPDVFLDEAFSVGDQTGFYDSLGEFGYSAGYDAANLDGREFRKGFAVGLARGTATGYDSGALDGAANIRGLLIATGRSIASIATDTTPPVIAAVSPTPNTIPGTAGGFANNYTTAKDTEIALDVTDLAPGLRFVSVNALFLDGTSEPVYLGSSFVHGYLANSFEGVITNGKRLHIRRDESWPGAASVSTNLAVGLLINAIDAAGNVSSTTFYWQLPVVVTEPTVVAAESVEPAAADVTAEILELVIWQFSSN